MSRIGTVLKNKNKRERQARKERQEELQDMQITAEYRARLHSLMTDIDIILHDIEVKSVRIDIPKEHINKFMRAIYGAEMSMYNIYQVDTHTFDISRKEIEF